jgi:predicted DNA-binding protein
MATTHRKTRRVKTQQHPTETYAARLARGKVTVSVSLPADAVEALAEVSARTGETKSAVVARLVLAERERS